jgi:nucleotide-binding universal stress UspA family protein
VGLLDRIGLPTGRAAKVIDGWHPGQFSTSGSATMPKPDMLPLEGDDGRNPNCKRNIVVAVTGDDLDNELVSLACNLAKAKKANVYAIYGIQVPRKLAIDAEMPEETAVATRALGRAEQLADQMHQHLEPEIVQSRNIGQSLVDEVKAHDCTLVVLGLPYNVGVGGHFDLGDTADFVLKNSPCRVWLVRGQQTEPAQTADQEEVISAVR